MKTKTYKEVKVTKAENGYVLVFSNSYIDFEQMIATTPEQVIELVNTHLVKPEIKPS